MKNLTRRDFLSKMVLSIVSAIGTNSVVYANCRTNTINIKNGHSLLLNECAIVYKEWLLKEKTPPADYFVSSMKEYHLDPWKVSDATKLDFQHQKFFAVNGLQLSKTEAAFLATLGSIAC